MRNIELFRLFGTILIDNKEAMASISNTGKKFEEIGSKFEKVGKSLTTKVTLPIMAIGGVIGKLGMDFESEMSKVQAISGATGDDLEKLKEKAKEMGANTKFSASESAQALTYMSMAGWKTEEMLGGLEGVMSLAAASGEDLALVSDIVTDALTGFGMKAEQAGEFADLLASASSNSNTNVSMMGETFKYVAPLFGSLGYSAEDAALATGLMANAGIKAGQAGTSLRSAITNLISPSKEAAGWIEQLGIETTDTEGQMIPFSDVMIQLREKFAGLSEEQQAQAASSMFGKQAMSGMLAIINASEEDFNKLTEATTNYNGAANKMAEIMEDNLGGRITKLKSALEGVALQLYEHLIPHFEKLVEWVQKGVDWFASLDEETQGMIVKIAMLVAAIGPAILIGGKIISGIGTIIGLFSKIGLLFSPAGLIIIGITAVIAAGVLLYKNWDKIKETAQKLMANIVEAWNNLKEKTVEAWDNIKKSVTDTVTKLATDAIQWGKDMVTGLWNGILGMKDWVVEKVTGFASDVANGFKKFFGIASPSTLMAEYGKNLDEGLAEGVIANEDIPLSAIQAVGDKMSKAAQDAVDKARAILAGENARKIGALIDLDNATKAQREKDVRSHTSDERYDDMYDPVWSEIDGKMVAGNSKVGFRKVVMDSLINVTQKDWEDSDIGKSLLRAFDKYGITDDEYEAMKGVAKQQQQINQTINVYSPGPLSPSETARQVKNASKELAMGV